MKIERKNRGITLVALVVTIVVLLILAGITISYVMGDNSVFKKASDAKVQTELGKIEERANLIYTDKLMKNVPDSLNNKPTMGEVVEQLKTEGCKIEQVAVSGDAITGISLSRESMTLGFGGSNTIKVTLLGEDNNDGYTYYALVDGKYYQMHYNNGNITIDRTPSEIASEGETPTLTASSSDATVATATLNADTDVVSVTANDSKEGTITITVTYGSYTKTCSVTVKDMPIATKLEMNSVRARIAVGYTRWLGAMTTPADALQEFDWDSSDKSIATVDNNGIVTAKKAGKTTITAKTADGSNKEGTCEVTVVETDKMVADLTDYQAANTVAKDENGNLITVPGDFKVLTDLGTKVTEGIVIQDRDGNEFVWVPVDSVSTGTSKLADDIRLGRYEDFTTKNTSGNYVPKQDADNYSQTISIEYNFQELTIGSGNIAAKSLGDFIAKAKTNGGYYFGRYEASKGSDNKVKSQFDKTPWTDISQQRIAPIVREMYSSSYVESDLINSYSWDTAIVFIQKYSGNSNYANNRMNYDYQANTGKAGDKVCNIHDMATNCYEWSTEYNRIDVTPCVFRGSSYRSSTYSSSSRNAYPTDHRNMDVSFRPLLYIK